MEQTLQVRSYLSYWKIHIEIALLTLLCVSQYFGITALNLLLTGSILIMHLSMNDMEECTIGLFCALPEFNLLNVRIGSISMYYLMVFIFWFRYFQYHNWRINKTRFMVLFILLVIRLTSGEVEDTLTWFVLLSVLVLTYDEDYFTKNLLQIVLFTSIVFLISSLAGYFMLIGGRSIYTGGTVWVGSTMSLRFAGIIGDPVFFSQCCSLFAAANLSLGCCNKKYLMPGILIAVGVFLLCLESYAKTGMLLIGLCFLASLMWLIWNRLQNKRTAILAVTLFFGGVTGAGLLVNYVLCNTDNVIIQNYIARLSSEDLLTGRLTVWKHYLSLLGDSWRSLICALPQSKFKAPVYFSGDRHVSTTHNVFIEMLCFFGIIPTLCIVTFVFLLIYRCFVRKKGIMWLMPICVMLASGLTLHGNQEFHYYTLVAIALAFLHIPEDASSLTTA